MNVAIVGLGKIGVPLAVQFASKGARVAGYDVSAKRVDEINSRHNPISGEPGLDEAISGLVANGALRATTDPCDAVAAGDVVVLIVPVDIDEKQRPDFAMLDAAVAAVAPHLRRGVLVLVETTVPVGTTRHHVGGQIAAATGMTAGADFSLAFSPERVSSGSVLRDLQTYPKIVGGIDQHSGELAATFYRSMLGAEITLVRDAETAEFTKLIETTYRDVNIALANEFARIADGVGVDALQAIAAANTQPYSHIHAPGPGVGGHCIPVYPHFLGAPELPQSLVVDTGLILEARRINDGMAQYAASRLAATFAADAEIAANRSPSSALTDRQRPLAGTTVLILGLAYRAGVKESRHSSALALASALRDAGARVLVDDPLYSDTEIAAHGLEPAPALPFACDAIVVQAWHEQYRTLDFASFRGLRAILDPRAALDPTAIRKVGINYVGVGR